MISYVYIITFNLVYLCNTGIFWVMVVNDYLFLGLYLVIFGYVGYDVFLCSNLPKVFMAACVSRLVQSPMSRTGQSL